MQQPEAKFKRALIEGYLAVFPQGWYNYNQANRRAGIPDLYFTVRRTYQANTDLQARGSIATPVWIEAKVDTKVTKLQTEIMRRMAVAGNKTVVVRALGMDGKKTSRNIMVLHGDTGCTMFGWGCMKTPAFWNRIIDA